MRSVQPLARDQRWRVSQPGRVVAWFSLVVCAVLALGCIGGLILGSAGRPELAFFVALFTALAIFAWRAGLHPSLALRGGELVVANPIRTRQIPVHDIVGVVPGYSGLVISYRDQGAVRFTAAWAVQKANVSAWMKRRTRSDEVAAAILSAARSGA